MVDFYQKLSDMGSSVNELLKKIPGFGGYLEMKERREADRLLRDHLVMGFEGQLNEFVRLQKRLIDKGGIMYMERIQGITGQMQTFIDRIRTAADGYSGVFDAVKVDNDALQRVYMFDNALMIYQDQFASGLIAFEEAIGTQEMDGVLDQFEELVAEANNTFKKRVEAFRGLEEAV